MVDIGIILLESQLVHVHSEYCTQEHHLNELIAYFHLIIQRLTLPFKLLAFVHPVAESHYNFHNQKHRRNTHNSLLLLLELWLQNS